MYPDELQRLPLRLEKMFFELQDRIMSDVVRRLRKTGEITSTADYQLIKVQILGSSTEFIESEIKRLTGMTDPEIWEVYDRVANKDYTRMKSTYEQINSNFVPYEENDILQQWTEAVVRQTKGSLENITRSLGFTVDMGGGRTAFTPLSQYYQQYLDRACLDVLTGSFDYNTVLRRVVKEMAASGLQMVDYASGYHSRAPVAARRALMTGVHQLTAKMNEKIAKDLHTDYYEVTAHAGARPTHAVWQGRVYHYRDLGIVCGLGDVTGLCGANCRHSYYAFIPGVSARTYTDDYLEDMRRKDAEIRTYHGKRYDGYEATQRQRQMETTMRAQRANIKQLKNGKADADIIRAAQTRYLTTLHEYQGFSKAMNLPEQMERVYMDGLGRMSGGRIPAKAFSGGTKSATIKKRIPQVPASTIAKKVQAGEYSLKLSQQQYDKHVFGSQKYMEYRQSRETKGGNPQSHILISAEEVQEIIRNKHGTGIIRVDRSGNPTNIERINCGKIIGQYYAKGEFHDTSKAALHYSKRGTHLVPIKGDDYD